MEVPRDTREPSDDESDLVEGEDPVDAGEPPEASAVTEDEADGTEVECRWETEEGADLFGDYMMANVVCTILALESTGSDVLADALAVLPDGALSSGEPRCQHWNFQLCNHWMENLADYARGRGYVDSKGAVRGPGNRVRIVVAAADPGVGNWVDPGGRDHGVMGLRFVQPATAPAVSSRLVPLEDLTAA